MPLRVFVGEDSHAQDILLAVLLAFMFAFVILVGVVVVAGLVGVVA
jgi:hypothetical protein